MLDRIKALNDELNTNFKKAYMLFEAEEHDANAPTTIFELHASLKAVEREYRNLEKHGFELLALHSADQESQFKALMADFNQQQNAVDDELSQLRQHVELVADNAVKRADADEKFLLVFSVGLTALAVLLGLGFAAAVTFVLVRNVRNLVRAAEAVEKGDLDTEVQVTTKDEVGKLGTSFNDMVGGLRMKERIKDTFGKYMDPRIVSKILENPDFAKLGGDRQEMTVMFIDLKGYTSISEKLPPTDLIEMLNIFLGNMSDAISAHHGVINDFLGDAVMAFWGPPFSQPDEHAAQACSAALEALDKFEEFRADVVTRLGDKADDLDLDMRIGISSGMMVAGNIGSIASRKFSVIGDPVNLGARLEGANKNYGTRVMLSERTRELAGAAVRVREIDLVRVKGKLEPTRVYELLPAKTDLDHLQDALQAYRNQDWDKAEQAFRVCLNTIPSDPVPQAFLNRIDLLRAQSPGQDWDGVWEFQTK